MYEMIVQVFLMYVFFASSLALTVDEDYDVSSRNPYSYKYNVDDPEKETSFEVSLIGLVSYTLILCTRLLNLETQAL